MFDAVPWVGPLVVLIFVASYGFVLAEEKLRIRKAKPVMVGAGLIWVLVGLGYHMAGQQHEVAEKLRHVLLEFAELFLFLLSAMSFVNSMIERNVFEALRTRLVAAQFSVRKIFWITGTCAFFLSPIADNLTTSLVMGTVVLSTFSHRKKEAIGALINIVVAANAGGAFSPFGDITTLMVWQKGMVEFAEFFRLFVPALVSWLVPAFIISRTLSDRKARATSEIAPIYRGGFFIMGLFLFTIAMTVTLEHTIDIPPFLGMMLGLGFLKVYGYFLRGREEREFARAVDAASLEGGEEIKNPWASRKPFDIFSILERVEWDTLLFFYGVMLCVGGLSAIGYLAAMSQFFYTDMGPTFANVLIGVLSAIVDNIPLTFAVLTMNPVMDHGQWLLITLTAGIGGSLLSIGSAAGVALMGIGRGTYTFFSHLKWSWAIALGYAAGILCHLTLNADHFTTKIF